MVKCGIVKGLPAIKHKGAFIPSTTVCDLVSQNRMHMRFNGLTDNGLVINNLSFNGLMQNGLNFNGLNINGLNFNGLNINGLNFNGLNFNGVNFNGLNFNGFNINSVNGLNLIPITQTIDLEKPPTNGWEGAFTVDGLPPEP